MKIINSRNDEHCFFLTKAELAQILGMAGFAIEHLTDDHTDQQAVDLLRIEIDLINELTKLLEQTNE